MRMTGIASFLAVCSLGTGHALAEGDAIKDGAKKVEQGFGEVLKGIGQEAKKVGEAVGTGSKDRKKSKPTETDKGKENRK